MTVMIDAIRLQDVVSLMTAIHDKWLHEEFDRKEKVLDFDELLFEEMGLQFRYSTIGGPTATRHYLKGRRWTVWVDLSTTASSVVQGTRRHMVDWDNMVYFSEGRSH